MNRHYIRETDDMNEQKAIDREFDHRDTKARGHWAIITLLFIAVVLAFCGTIAHAQTARSAVISYQAPTTRTDGSTITGALSYEIWQGVKGAVKTKVGTITSIQTTITTGLQGGKEYCWQVAALEAGGGTSALSNEACKAFAIDAPNTVTITVT